VTPGGADEPIARRSADAATAPVGDSLLVYDGSRETAHLLNPTAAAIWRLVDGTRGPAAIADAVARQFATEPEAISDDVRAVLENLVDLGVITANGASPPTPATPVARASGVVDGPSAGAGPPVWPGPAATIGPFDALGFGFTIVAPPDLADRLAATLRALRALGAPVAGERTEADHRYVIAPDATGADDPRVAAWHDDELVASGRQSDVVATVLWHINNQAVSRPYDGLLVHASAVVHRGHVVALAGTMDAGKSTLVAALARRGHPYVTDEAVAIPRGTLDVEAYPKPIGLDPGSWPLLADLRGAALEDVTSRWWVDATAIALASTETNRARRPLGAVVLVQHRPSATTELERLAPPEAALTLTGNLFNLAAEREAALACVAAVAEAVPCYRLTSGDLDEAVAAVEEVAAAVG
jgi:hypothetical protein